MMKVWSRKCPKCGLQLQYSCYDSHYHATKKNAVCKSCSTKGRPGWMKGKKQSLQWIEKMKTINNGNTYRLGKVDSIKTKQNKSKSQKGHEVSVETRNKISSGHIGKKLSEQTKHKLRLATIEDLKRKGILTIHGGNFNAAACKFIDKLNVMLGLNLQHALNGGEVEISGYFVDGYDKEKNVVFEYDEPQHYSLSNRKREMIRQKTIIEKTNPRMFLRYDEKNNRVLDVMSNSTIEIL